MYPNLEVIEEEKKSLSEKEMTWMQGAEYLVDGLAQRQYGLRDEWKELYSWYFEQEKNQENPLVLQRILDAAFYKKEKMAVIAERKAYYHDPVEDAIIMKREIDEG